MDSTKNSYTDLFEPNENAYVLLISVRLKMHYSIFGSFAAAAVAATRYSI